MDSKLSIYGKKGYRNSYNCIFNTQQTAFGAIARKTITDDPKWNEGDYYGKKCPPRTRTCTHGRAYNIHKRCLDGKEVWKSSA
jgi:hypothetical protein